MVYRILIIEDDLTYKPLWKNLLDRNLENNQALIEWAVSAEEAGILYDKSIQNQQPFDFIITDLFLAGSDTGIDFVEKAALLGKKVPPVILISSVGQEDVEAVIKANPCHIEVLTKPINSKRLKEVLQRIKFLNREEKL